MRSPMDDTVALAKLLRALAIGSFYREHKHDVILNAAADFIERLTARQLDALGDICRRIAASPPKHWPIDMDKEQIWCEAAMRCEATIRAERLKVP